MAFDKIVDSAVLEAGLKKVGDSIRAKAGTSELLEFPDAMSAAVDAIDTSEDLDDALDDQENLIDQIQAALEGKAGVSAPSVETCTLTLSGAVADYAVTVYDNNTISHRYVTNINTKPIEVSNVVCNSIIIVSTKSIEPAHEIIGTAEYLYYNWRSLIFSAPAQPEECSIRMIAGTTGGAD